MLNDVRKLVEQNVKVTHALEISLVKEPTTRIGTVMRQLLFEKLNGTKTVIPFGPNEWDRFSIVWNSPNKTPSRYYYARPIYSDKIIHLYTGKVLLQILERIKKSPRLSHVNWNLHPETGFSYIITRSLNSSVPMPGTAGFIQ